MKNKNLRLSKIQIPERDIKLKKKKSKASPKGVSPQSKKLHVKKGRQGSDDDHNNGGKPTFMELLRSYAMRKDNKDTEENERQ